MKNLYFSRICYSALLLFLLNTLSAQLPPLTKNNILKVSDKMLPGDTLYAPSKAKKTILVFQKNGYLVLLESNSLTHGYNTIWKSPSYMKTGNPTPKECRLTENGSLNCYDIKGKMYWSSNTFGMNNYLKIENDSTPRAVIYKKNGEPIWVNGYDVIFPPTDLGSNILYAGKIVNIGEGIYSPNKTSYITLEQDGNLVFRWIGEGVSKSKVIWKSHMKSNTPIPNAKYFKITNEGTKLDGDLEILTANDSVAWDSKTRGIGNYLEVNNDLTVEINSANHESWWTNGVATIIPGPPAPGQQPLSDYADIGYGPLPINLHDYTSSYFEALAFVSGNEINISAEGGDVGVDCGKADANMICPQHRSVGESRALDKPRASYEILEGIVQRHEANIAGSDFPTSHYTHDFDFTVKPDPAFHFLLGGYYGPKQTATCIECDQIKTKLESSKKALNKLNACEYCDHANNYMAYWVSCDTFSRNIIDLQKQADECDNLNCIDSTKMLDSKDYIEVEWESGLAAGNNNSPYENPAYNYNKTGKSFGFFSTGHQLGDVIWNWPSYDDWVHVEGIWIFERGHRPAHTEIHPAHFIAIRRNLPASFTFDENNSPQIRNQPDDRFIATRVDVFASADGSAMWNTKGLNTDFVQVVDMQRKDYTFLISHPYTKVTKNAKLKWTVVKQKGDNFPADADPIINLLPNNEIQVIVPWKTKHVNNTAIFARTILVYWDDTPNLVTVNTAVNKVVETERPRLYKINILKINLLKEDMDDDNTEGFTGIGQFRVFCNVGNDWIFLNEFAAYRNPADNILGSGIGLASGSPTSPKSYSYSINDSFFIYVPINKSFRFAFNGWEADGIDYIMGHIFNEYSRDKEALSKYFASELRNLHDRGSADDIIGSIDKRYSISQLEGNPFKLPSTLHGEYKDEKNKIIQVFNIVYTIKELPYSASLPLGSVHLPNTTH